MQIIDAHIHYFMGASLERAEKLAKAAGHENSIEHLRGEYKRLGLTGAVVMGNRSLEPDFHEAYPEFMRYCVGLDTTTNWEADLKATYDLVERNLKLKECVGVKLYAGYVHRYVSDAMYGPVYELCEHYNKPVAIHTGETASSTGHLKYAHPLTMDEVAVMFPKVNFVMCHFGNPWFADAAAVLDKNANVSADLSGFLVGKLDMDKFFCEKSGYIEQLRTWLEYLGDYDRLMFGTDWPLANIGDYIEFVSRIIPEKHHEKVFAHNARRIYDLDF